MLTKGSPPAARAMTCCLIGARLSSGLRLMGSIMIRVEVWVWMTKGEGKYPFVMSDINRHHSSHSLIAKCNDGMCTGTHGMTEMISLRMLHSTSGMRICIHQSFVLYKSEPAISHHQQSDNRWKNNTICSLCLQRTVQKDMLSITLMLPSHAPFDYANGSDKHSKICYMLLTKEWRMKKQKH